MQSRGRLQLQQALQALPVQWLLLCPSPLRCGWTPCAWSMCFSRLPPPPPLAPLALPLAPPLASLAARVEAEGAAVLVLLLLLLVVEEEEGLGAQPLQQQLQLLQQQAAQCPAPSPSWQRSWLL